MITCRHGLDIDCATCEAAEFEQCMKDRKGKEQKADKKEKGK
jgi:hypothetical protein